MWLLRGRERTRVSHVDSEEAAVVEARWPQRSVGACSGCLSVQSKSRSRRKQSGGDVEEEWPGGLNLPEVSMEQEQPRQAKAARLIQGPHASKGRRMGRRQSLGPR